MTLHQKSTATSLSKSASSSTRVVVSMTLLLACSAVAPLAQARCEDGQREVATLFVNEARENADDIEKLVLLKRSVKACPEFVAWIELGKVQLALDNSNDAAGAFENARDYYSPDADGSFTSNEIRRQAISSAWLAEAYQLKGDLAPAAVATQEATNAFRVLNIQPPQRLVRIQAEIDDALAGADASVLARSMKLQHDRATRGIGIRTPVRTNEEATETTSETDRLELDYGGETLASVDLDSASSSASVERADDGAGEAAVAASGSTTSGNASQPMVESRLNIPVLFDYNSADLSVESRDTVSRLGAAINELHLEPAATVTIVGHTDARGSADYNLQLSVRRADTVSSAVQALLQTPVRFESIGRGENQLRYLGQSEDDHRRNRRVEIIVKR